MHGAKHRGKTIRIVGLQSANFGGNKEAVQCVRSKTSGESDRWKTFYWSSREKSEWLGLLELKDPGAMLELIAVMELGVVRGSIDPHFVDNFEPALAEPAQGIGVALVLFAMMLIVKLGPDAAGETLLSKKVDGMTQMFVASPTLMNGPVFARTLFA